MASSIKTTLWIQYSAKELAFAFIQVTAKLSNIELPNRKSNNDDQDWYETEGVSIIRMQGTVFAYVVLRLLLVGWPILRLGTNGCSCELGRMHQ
jgi:hypothetical protein